MTDHAAIGRASRAKGNRYQRDACNFLNAAWAGTGWECTVTGIYQRRWQDNATPDLTVTGVVECTTCNGSGYVPRRNGEKGGICRDCLPEYGGSGEPGEMRVTLRGECKGAKDLPLYLWRCPECEGHGTADGEPMPSPSAFTYACARCKGSGLRGPKRPPRKEWWTILEGVRCNDGAAFHHAGRNSECIICHGTGWLSMPHDFLIVKRYGAKPACDWLVLVKEMAPAIISGLCIPRDGHCDIHVYTAADWAAAICNVKE